MTPETTAEHLRVLTFNLNNPSPERAERQLAWLANRPEQVLVLTETAPSKGCDILAERFSQAGYEVDFPAPGPGERGVMIVSRLPLAQPEPCGVDYLPCRAVSVAVKTANGPVDIVGLYIPSRDATPEKTERKRRFLSACRQAIPPGNTQVARLIIGDFNILEPDHQPRYPFFRPFEYAFYEWLGQAGYRDAFRLLYPDAAEYSWVGRTGDGYRYDHIFTSDDVSPLVDECAYVHEPRNNRLTDHSAMRALLRIPVVDPLVVSDPTATPAAETLF
ncbi:endonuclease/exonuclease/phosphatase family protein [Streptomyces sp. SBT349]|uniref:endonuclease/exonuclease/phosphatase family protein n=1 Tax=Streptomyces sp. SBT349 TaxID=1580539 RepID=UPI0007C63655|nr:endonuclease/exonuclease/phosphatase family protein [Streptomyces sp. SBT349]